MEWPKIHSCDIAAVENLLRRQNSRSKWPTQLIHRPLRRYSHLYWSAVDTVAAPAPEFHSVRLNLVNGPTISLADIPATESAAVAALGGKRIERPLPVRLPPRSPTRRTDQDVEADVARRAKALAEERAVMEANNPRLRRHQPPPLGPASP